MPHLDPLDPDDVPELRERIDGYLRMAGFVPNSVLTMARRPAIVEGFNALSAAVLREGTVSPELKRLVANVASTAAGCRYCQAHTAAAAQGAGATDDRLARVWEFEQSSLFTPAERAALRLARDAAVVPNAVSEEHFADLRPHFDEGEIVELVAVISLFGFLNRWNDTFATRLEDEPAATASRVLPGWVPGKHAVAP